jgi:hypothetical protein
LEIRSELSASHKSNSALEIWHVFDGVPNHLFGVVDAVANTKVDVDKRNRN